MKIKNLDTNEIETIEYLVNGCDVTPDLILVDENVRWDKEEETYVADGETMIWWKLYIDGAIETDSDVTELAEELDIDPQDIWTRIQNECDTDYEYHREIAIRVMSEIRNEH